MANNRARQDTTLRPRTLKIAPDELEAIQRAATGAGVSVSHLLRAAGNEAAANPKWLAASLANQVKRDGRTGGNSLP